MQQPENTMDFNPPLFPSSQSFPGWPAWMDRERDDVDAALWHTFDQLVQGVLPWPLLIVGPVGVGKTLGALCLMDRVNGRRLYRTVNKLLNEVVNTTVGDPFGYMTIAHIAILDELGVSDPSPFERRTVGQAIDSRIGKPSIYISNKPVARLSELYDDRIASRLASGTIYHMTGDDRRIQNTHTVKADF